MNITKRVLDGGITVNTVVTDKFKTDSFSVNFILPLERETLTAVNIINGILQRGCEEYPTFEAISARLNDLYGAEITSDCRARGNRQILSFSATCLRDRFSEDGTDISGGVLDMLRRIMFFPVTEGAGFNAAYTESEKQRLCDYIASLINEKGAYARRRLYEEMFAGEPGALPEAGYAEDIPAMTPETLYNIYRDIIRSAPVEIFAMGDMAESETVRRATALFTGVERKVKPHERFLPVTKHPEVPGRFVPEQMDVTQGKLAIGFRTPRFLSAEHEYSDFLLACEVLGGSPASKLFMHVREELNLCYYCNSVYSGVFAAMFIYAGIDRSNFGKATAAIREMTEDVCAGRFTDEELDIAKKSLKSSIRTGLDSPQYVSAFFLARSVCGVTDTPEKLIERIESASAGDVAAAMRTAECDTVYFLCNDTSNLCPELNNEKGAEHKPCGEVRP